jgi:YHS domain-containing protein
MTKLTNKILSKMGMHVETKGHELDLVCGMEISGQTKNTVSHNDTTYYFCSSNCQKHFRDDPEKYIGE